MPISVTHERKSQTRPESKYDITQNSVLPPPRPFSSILHILPFTPDLSIFVIITLAFKIQLLLLHHFLLCNCWYFVWSASCPPNWKVQHEPSDSCVAGRRKWKILSLAKSQGWRRAQGAEANTTFCFHKSQPAPSEARGRRWRPSSKKAERHPGNPGWPFHRHWTQQGWSDQTTSSKCCASSLKRV